jgi:hypothetical protein
MKTCLANGPVSSLVPRHSSEGVEQMSRRRMCLLIAFVAVCSVVLVHVHAHDRYSPSLFVNRNPMLHPELCGRPGVKTSAIWYGCVFFLLVVGLDVLWLRFAFLFPFLSFSLSLSLSLYTMIGVGFLNCALGA